MIKPWRQLIQKEPLGATKEWKKCPHEKYYGLLYGLHEFISWVMFPTSVIMKFIKTSSSH